jgi:Tat protein translocase TatB subunit
VGGVGFSELLLLALITLLVVGPKRLPEVARTIGQWTRHARQAWGSLKSEFQQEMDRDHNQRILDAERAEASKSSSGPSDKPSESKQADDARHTDPD